MYSRHKKVSRKTHGGYWLSRVSKWNLLIAVERFVYISVHNYSVSQLRVVQEILIYITNTYRNYLRLLAFPFEALRRAGVLLTSPPVVPPRLHGPLVMVGVGCAVTVPILPWSLLDEE